MTLLEFVRERSVALMVQSGFPLTAADAIAERLDHELRINYGARINYVHGEDLAKRDANLKADWARAISENAANDTPRRIGHVRDQICATHGISRRTFYRILSG